MTQLRVIFFRGRMEFTVPSKGDTAGGVFRARQQVEKQMKKGQLKVTQ
nr:hypothetical protein [Coprococcus catus]